MFSGNILLNRMIHLRSVFFRLWNANIPLSLIKKTNSAQDKYQSVSYLKLLDSLQKALKTTLEI